MINPKFQVQVIVKANSWWLLLKIVNFEKSFAKWGKSILCLGVKNFQMQSTGQITCEVSNRKLDKGMKYVQS